MVYLAQTDKSKVQDWDFDLGHDDWFDAFCEDDNPGIFPSKKQISGRLMIKPSEPEPMAAFGGAIVFFANEAFKDILENLEPGVHAFAPFELRYGTKKDFTSHQYYAVRPGQIFDAVDTAVSELEWRDGTHGATRYWRKKDGVPLTFDPDLIKGKHLWRKTRPDYRFLSDELHDAIQAAGMSTSWAFEKQLVRGQAIAAE